jgi:hypothetical protein
MPRLSGDSLRIIGSFGQNSARTTLAVQFVLDAFGAGT